MIATIIIICLSVAGLVYAGAKHGEDKGTYNGWTSFFAFVVQILLYWWAGLFDKFFS